MSIYSRKNTPSGFYVYAYLRNDGTPYYIGKGSSSRAWKSHGINLPKNKNNIIIMESNLTEIGALALERFYIKWYGRKDLKTGILRNMTDGGDGSTNIIPWNKGIKRTDVDKLKISESLKGKTPWNKGIKGSTVGNKSKRTEQTIEKIKQSRKKQIIVHSDETKRKMAESRKLYWLKRKGLCDE
jgi:hypothetical protein